VIAAPAEARACARAFPRRVIAGFVLVALALVLLGETLGTSDRPTVAVVWGGLSFAAYALGLMCLIGPGRPADLGLARWKIGPWMLLWYSVIFGVATVTWSQPQVGTASEIAVSSVLRALWLVAVGVSAWAIGYCVGPGRAIRSRAARVLSAIRRRFATEVRSPTAPWLLYVIGMMARLANALTTGRLGYVGDVSSAYSTATGYGGILGALSLCAPLAVAAAAIQVFRERLPGARITLAVLFLVELAFGAAAGGKQNFVIAILGVIIPFCAARRRMPKVALIVLILLFIAVVVPFNQAYRDAARQGSTALTESQAVAAAPGILRQTVAGHSVITVLPNSVDYLAQRVRDIDPVAIIVQRTPGQIKFQSPFQLIEGPVAGFVPRALWPGKPIMATGYKFSQEFIGLPSTTYTSTADTIVGGLYWYGGWVPVLVCMSLFGCAVRLLDDVIDVHANPLGIFLVLLLFPSLVRSEYDWQSILAGIPTSILVWLFSLSVIFGARRHA
jgi:hypothetical protein